MFRGLVTSESGPSEEVQAEQPGQRAKLGSGGGWCRPGRSLERRAETALPGPQTRGDAQGGCTGMAVNTSTSSDCPGPVPNQ